MDQLRGNRKGVMFTLVTVVIVVLLLGEVLTYLYTNTQYSNLGVQATPSLAASTLYSQISASAPSFLQTSLIKATYALSAYERSNLINHGVNSGSYALQSLIDNGTIYGANMVSYMGGYTLLAYSNTLNTAAQLRGLKVTMSNYNAIVFQNSPSQISVTFSTLLNVSSQYGYVSYPITANASVPISGLPDLFGGSLGTGSLTYSSNKTVAVSNSYASLLGSGMFVGGNIIANALTTKGGSRSVYLFAVGPLFVDNTVTAACNDGPISKLASPANYILVTANAVNINSQLCGFAGLVTANAPTAQPNGPFMVYNVPAAGNSVINDFRTGGMYILDGNTLTLYDPSSLQAAVNSGSYVGSSFSPTYLNLIGGDQLPISPYGDAPLGVASRYVASLDGSTSYITSPASSSLLIGAQPITISAWIYPASFSSGEVILHHDKDYTLYIQPSTGYVSYANNGDWSYSDFGYKNIGLQTNKWQHIVLTQTGGTVNIYLNGVLESASSFAARTTPTNYPFYVGVFADSSGGSGLSNYFNGAIADVQIYNSVLSSYQAESLYLGGINGAPVNYSSLVGWWPLNGNLNDYSPYHNNGAPGGSLTYSRLSGYFGDSLDGGSFYWPTVSGVEGISQCYSRNACSSGPGAIYVPVIPPNYATNLAQPATSGLGFINSTIPSSGYFNGASSYVGIPSSSFSYPASGTTTSYTLTFSAWFRATSGGVILGQTSDCTPPTTCVSYVPSLYVDSGGLLRASLFWHGSVSSQIVSAGTYNNGVWHNVVDTYNNGVETLYVDGVSIGSQSVSEVGYVGTAYDYFIGTGSTNSWPSGNGGWYYFPGQIADVQVYGSALSATQVGQLYLNNTVPGISPVSWLSLNGNVNDQSGNSNNGVAVSMTYLPT